MKIPIFILCLLYSILWVCNRFSDSFYDIYKKKTQRIESGGEKIFFRSLQGMLNPKYIFCYKKY